MNNEIYLIKIGKLEKDNEGFYDLKDINVLTIPMTDYVESQKLLFWYRDTYLLDHKKLIIWMEVLSIQEKFDKPITGFNPYYFYLYCDHTEINEKIALEFGNKQPKDKENDYYSWNTINHYIPKEKVDEYKQAIMEYKLMNK